MTTLSQATCCGFSSAVAWAGFLCAPRTSLRGLVVRAKVEPSEKSVEIMRKFSEQYARKSGTYFCMDKGVISVVIKGLADHKDDLGAPLCPCRHYDDKPAEAGQGFWNCPCVPMRESELKDDLYNFGYELLWNTQFSNLQIQSSLRITDWLGAFYTGRSATACSFLLQIMIFAGKDQTISLEEIKETTANM